MARFRALLELANAVAQLRTAQKKRDASKSTRNNKEAQELEAQVDRLLNQVAPLSPTIRDELQKQSRS